MLDPNSSSAQDLNTTGLTAVLGWCRKHIVIAICVAIVTLYLIGFRVYYCNNEGCTHPANWWFHLSPEGQAAWVGSLGTLVAVWWGFVLFWQRSREKREVARKAAQPIADRLIEKIEAIEHGFAQLGISASWPAWVWAKYAKRGDLTHDLLAVRSAFAFFQDDEIATLIQLNTALGNLNESASRCGTDLNYGGTTGEDMLVLSQRAHVRAREARSLLQSRYAVKKVRALEASDSGDNDERSDNKP